ncbi:hypothetical protein AcW1_008857 [Taiwanofungus camphoratus]|nr:hypothetical protein AcV7_007139 [Antrodia cinnamomea]KAI0930091.1 hypothetical protein AcV5_006888 [Antrodia cinnamomea]KAI0949166.1 hypothetical protein AcW1_008857 [Antrodia cinnamomea]
MLASTIVLMTLAAATPISAAPMAISTVVEIPGVVTMTVGLVGPSELPNLPLPTGLANNIPPAGQRFDSNPHLAHDMFSPVHIPILRSLRSDDLERRQIRINDYDATENMTLPSLLNPTMTKRNEKADEAERARLHNHEDDTAETSDPAPHGPNVASPVNIISSVLEALGEVRTNASALFHTALADVFHPQASSQHADGDGEGSEGSDNTDSTDTADNVDPGDNAPTRRDLKPTYFFSRFFSFGRSHIAQRHSMVLDTDAILPPPPVTTDTTAAPQPTPAYENMGLINIDSNHPPTLPEVPQNLTTTNDATQAPANVTSTV